MTNTKFNHNDIDSCHDKVLTLHDCIAERVTYSNSILRFFLSDGFWITPQHTENTLNKTVRTDAAVVDFHIADIDDIIVRVFTQTIFKKTRVELWKMPDLMHAINNGEYTIEFIYQYRTHFEQMWQCAIHSKKKLYYRECQLHLPETNAVFRWNSLRPDREW